MASLLISLGLTVGATTAGAAVLATSTPAAAWRVDGVARTVLVVGDTTYVGGSFTRAIAPNGTSAPRGNLAAFDTRTGALVAGFRADTNGVVRALAADGSTLWVGGSYSAIGGQNRGRLATLDLRTGAVRTGFSANANSNVYALDLRAGRLFVGGSFNSIRGVARNRVAAVDPSSGAVDPQWNPGADNTVLAVRANPSGSVVYLGGSFASAGGATRTGLAAVSGVTGAAVAPIFTETYRPTLDLDMDPTGTRLFAAVGGGGNQAAAWNTSTGRRLWRQRADGDVQTVAFHRDTVYFGFHESFEGDLSLRLLAANASTGALDAGFRPTFDRYWGLYDLSVSDDAVAGAGDFTQVDGVSAQGLALFPSVVAPPPSPPDVVHYVSASSTWRYHDAGTVPGVGWQQPGFDDDSFSSGRPEFGYGDGDETTVVSFGPSSTAKHLATYFRTTFESGARPDALTVSLVADDGAVVYLNGVEVVRDNMPTGAVTNTTRAATNRSSAAEHEVRAFTIDPGLLVAGTNTIAASAHQDAPASSDLSFELQLMGEVPASGPTTTTTTTAPPPTTTTTTTAPPPTTTASVLASWSDGSGSFSSHNGTRAVIEQGGSYGERLRWDQAPNEVAYRTWAADRLGAPRAQHALRWISTFSAWPSSSFSVAQGLNQTGSVTQRWRIEVTSTGRIRIRNAANAIAGESTGAALPLGAEIRFEAVRSGTTMTVSAFSPASSTTPIAVATGAVGTDVDQVRIGVVTRTPTVPSFTVDEVVLTDGDTLVGPPN